MALPGRIGSPDPIERKWRQVPEHDERAAPSFAEAFPAGSSIDRHGEVAGGRPKIFHDNGVPKGGLLRHPRLGPEAFAVHGPILAEDLNRGACEGRHGFPTSDVDTFTSMARKGMLIQESDGLDRICTFETGLLWWRNETGAVSDTRPENPLMREPLGPALTRPTS